jgi:hypothetical protein
MNLLDAEPLILARLAAQITGVNIASAATIAGALDLAGLLPAAFVQPGAADVVSYSGDNKANAEDETWYVIGADKLVADTVDLAGDYQAIGLLLGQIVAALAGWAPTGYRPFKYAGREEPSIEPGHAEFPLRFITRRIFTGTGG